MNIQTPPSSPQSHPLTTLHSPSTNTTNNNSPASPQKHLQTTPSTATAAPSTPSNNTNNDDGLFGLNIGERYHCENLTPVIANVSYVDSSSSSKSMLFQNTNGGRMNIHGDSNNNNNRGLSSGGLRQRRLPLPRGSSNKLPGEKNSGGGIGGFFPATNPSCSSSVVGALKDGGFQMRVVVDTMMSGVVGNVDGVPGGDEGNNNNEGNVGKESNTQSTSSKESLMEGSRARLSSATTDSTPSLPGIYNDDSSLDGSTRSNHSATNNGNGNNKRGGVVDSSVRHPKKSKESNIGGSNTFLLAPIELKPERKFFSFQGSSQYRSQLPYLDGGGDTNEGSGGKKGSGYALETIYSPPRKKVGDCIVVDDSPSTPAGAVAVGNNTNASPRPYEPWGRSQHGVTDMADTKDLDAIFKSPRITTPTRGSGGDEDGGTTTTTVGEGGGEHNNIVVTPAKDDEDDNDLPSPPSTNTTHLQQPFPLDTNYSIPSIRLANAVHRTDSLASYEMYSRTFSEDESTWEGSYVGDYDEEDSEVGTEVSWASGSWGSLRRRGLFRRGVSSGGMMSSESLEEGRLSSNSGGGGGAEGGEGLMMSGSLEGLGHLNSSEGEGQVVMARSSSNTPPSIAPSNSFMERMQGITLTQRSNTFESTSDADSHQGGDGGGGGRGPPVVLDVDSHHPTLIINATQSMDDAEYETRQDHRVRRSNHHGHRSARRRRSSHARTSSAVEWIQMLKNPNNGGGVQIVEAASSKFLIGGNREDGGGVEDAGNGVGDVSKALGMPHPLCRSSTIEAGPFVNRVATASAARNNVDGSIGE